MIKVQLKGDVIKEYEKGITIAEVAKDLGMGLYKAACAGKIEDTVCDLRTPIEENCALTILTFDDINGRKTFWHSAAHLMAQAVKRLFPNTKLGIGPAIDNGFYYDFKAEQPFSSEDLQKIEKEMKKIVKENLKIERFTLSVEKALSLMEKKQEPYKVELIQEHAAKGEELSFYQQGEFIDLCAGPHLISTGALKAIKLTQTTGAYWRGDAANDQLSRIYGVAFPKASQLEEHLTRMEEAKKRDHNLIGRQLNYFMTDEVVGQGLPLLPHKGAKLFQILSRFIEDESEKRGYMLTKTPYMAKRELYKISGHWDHYRDGMFILGDPDAEGEVLALRPMTCPFQYTIYNAQLHSYKELPLRYQENSTLYRNEASGEMHGLIRIRQFTLSDAHTMVAPEQVEDEFGRTLEFIKYVMQSLGIEEDVTYRFSKWDPNNKEKYIDLPEQWEKTQNEMRNILNHLGVNYVEADDEAAFYGPKLDLQMKNVHGKEDTIITIQIDFSLAERFNMVYVDADGQKKHPYIIHHSIVGCFERTIALLIEKYAGALPVWLSPIQVTVLPIGERQHEEARKIEARLLENGIRVNVDVRNEKIGYKIREAQLEKTPYMLVLGDKEIEAGTVSVRSRKDGNLGNMPVDAFIEKIKLENDTKVLA